MDESEKYDVIVTRRWLGGWARTPIAGPFEEMFEAQHEAKRLKEVSPDNEYTIGPHHVCPACYDIKNEDLEHTCKQYLRSLMKNP